MVHMVHNTAQINGSGSRYFTVDAVMNATRAGLRTITAALATRATVAAGDAVVTAAALLRCFLSAAGASVLQLLIHTGLTPAALHPLQPSHGHPHTPLPERGGMVLHVLQYSA